MERARRSSTSPGLIGLAPRRSGGAAVGARPAPMQADGALAYLPSLQRHADGSVKTRTINRLQAAANRRPAPLRGPVQGKFVGIFPTFPQGAVVPLDALLAALGDTGLNDLLKQLCGRYKLDAEPTLGEFKAMLRIIERGLDTPFRFDGAVRASPKSVRPVVYDYEIDQRDAHNCLYWAVVGRLESGGASFADLFLKAAGRKDKVKDPAWFKIEKIAAQIQTKLQVFSGMAYFGKELSPYVGPLHGVLMSLGKGATETTIADHVLPICFSALRQFVKAAEVEPRGVWAVYSTLSQIGPLTYWIGQRHPKLDVHKDASTLLRAIRQALAKSSMPTVVAHRGTGPTNRTMGGLIKDQRRDSRPAENSMEAFKAASGFAKNQGKFGSLDGVECDVYLSKDNVAIVSHEGKILEQISKGVKISESIKLTSKTEIADLDANVLKTIQRTKTPDSRFISLDELVDLMTPAAWLYYQQTGRAFRIEVEMKGIPKGTVGGHPLETVVAKSLSKYRKRSLAPVEFIMFHGADAQVGRFSDLRSRKSSLGMMYTGVNYGGGKADPVTVDELRYMFTKHLPVKGIETNLGGLKGVDEHLEHFIVTLVHGQEFLPSDLVKKSKELVSIEPSEDVYKRYGHKTEVKDALEARERGAPTYDDYVIEAVKQWYAGLKNKQTKLHILTDYPSKAAYIKEQLASLKG